MLKRAPVQVCDDGTGGCVYHIVEYPLGWLIINIDGFGQ
jgi:hypothetical protein